VNTSCRLMTHLISDQEWLREAIAMNSAPEGCLRDIEWVRWSFQQAFMHLALGTGYDAGLRLGALILPSRRPISLKKMLVWTVPAVFDVPTSRKSHVPASSRIVHFILATLQ
jgi:hypothetical protein